MALTGASKMALMDLFAGRNRDTDVEDGLMDTAGEGEVGQTESSFDIYTLPCME